MLNGPAVAFPAVFLGAASGTVVWFLTKSPALTAVLALAVAVMVGRYCYKQLLKP